MKRKMLDKFNKFNRNLIFILFSAIGKGTKIYEDIGQDRVNGSLRKIKGNNLFEKENEINKIEK